MNAVQFAISGQHYLFNVQAFASMVLANGGDEFSYALRDRTTRGVLKDVAEQKSEIGIIMQTTETADKLNEQIEAMDLEFVQLAESYPRIALSAGHPLVMAKELSFDQLEDYPYIYFEQEDDDPYFYEEAFINRTCSKKIACTDRASLSELIAALNGYTVTSGIMVGVSDGARLDTVALDTDITLRLGYVKRKGAALSSIAEDFIVKLQRGLSRYAFN